MEIKHERGRVLLSLICIVSLSVFNPMHIPTVSQAESPVRLRYVVYDASVGELTHIVRISNPSYAIFAGGEFYVPLVRNETSRHYVILYNVTSPVGQPIILKDDSGNLYAYWKNVVINAKDTFVAELSYRVLSFGTQYHVSSDQIADYDKNSELYKRYTEAEDLIQSDNLEICAKARNLTDSIPNVHDKIFRIYDFVTSHVHFSNQEEERGALWALENESGDCSEYSYLFTALCRAIGVPAKAQAGFAFQSTGRNIEDGHMWAEYYLENYGWIPVDATWRSFDRLDSRHFSSIQSIPGVIPYSNYVFNSTVEAELVDKQTVTLKHCSPDTFPDQTLARYATKTVQRTASARLYLLLGRLFGGSLMFSSDVRSIEEELQGIETDLQSTVESWPIEHDIEDMLHGSEMLESNASMLVIKAFASLLSVIATAVILVLLCVTSYLGRSRKRGGSIDSSLGVSHIESPIVEYYQLG